MTETPAPIEDRAANIKDVVLHIITSKQDEMFDAFDRLHRRNIHDDDVAAALRSLHEEDLLDAYAEWGDIDIREDDNTTTNPVVPDPMDADGNRQLAERDREQRILDAIVEQLKAERERELYFNPDYDDEDSMLDGPVNLRKLAKAVAAVTK